MAEWGEAAAAAAAATIWQLYKSTLLNPLISLSRKPPDLSCCAEHHQHSLYITGH